MDQKLSKFDKQFKEIDKRFTKIDKRLDSIETRLENLERLEGIADKKLDFIEEKFKEVDERFDRLENYITSRFIETDSKIDEVLEETNFMRKLGELHTIKIGRLETNYKTRN